MEAGARAADEMLETQLRLATLPALSLNHLRLLLWRRCVLKGIHISSFVIPEIVHPVLWQISGRGDTELTARKIDAAESRPNRFCMRRTRLVHDADDPTGVEPPNADGPNHDHYGLAGLNRRLGRPRFHPAQTELIPPLEGSPGGMEHGLPRPQFNAGAIQEVFGRRRISGCSHCRIAEVQLRLFGKDAADGFGCGFS